MAGLRPLGRERWWVLVFLAPTFIGLVLGSLGAILASFGISLFDWDLLSPPKWAGLANYLGLPADRLFMKSLWNTLAFAGLYVLKLGNDVQLVVVVEHKPVAEVGG